jgi:probable F420-dependent oxidoreductase
MRLDDRAGVVALARTAEDLGYKEFFSYDHIGAIDPFVPLCMAAAATQRLRVGPLVLNNELHHPALLARTAASVDRLTGGRLVLGLGTGYMQSEHDAIGVPLRPPPERVRRFEESLAVLRSLLDTGSAHLSGDHHRVAIEDLGVRAVQERVPFLVGGHGRRVVEAAARYADIFQFTGLTHGAGGVPGPGGFDIDAVTRRAQWLTEAAGERNADIERSALVQITQIGPGGPARLAEISEQYHLPVEVLDTTPFILVGSVAGVVDKLERMRESLGISHLVVRDAEGFAPVVEALSGR